MTSTATKQSELEALLHTFHLPSFGRNYQQFARQAEKERVDHVGYLYHLAKVESEDRYNRKTERLIRQAKLPRGKTLEQFDLARFTGLSDSPTVRCKRRSSLVSVAYAW